jgi:2-polyprenyl-3-methyl-5-hydroxy-6-metoxy-1,4-benzoquinol methylase
MQGVSYQVTSHARAPECVKIHDRLLAHVRRVKPTRILDVGCGAGDLCAALLHEGFDVVGMEPTEAMARIAARRCGADRVLRASCYENPPDLRLGLFDLVVSSEVIEHLYHPEKLVSFSAALLARGGTLLLSTPDYGNYFRNLFLSALNRWDHHHSPLWEGGHIKFFSRRTLRELLERGPFRIKQWDSVASCRAPIFPMSMIALAERT